MLHHLLIGAVASILMAVGLLMMKSRGPALPEARPGRLLAAALAWFRDPIWLGSIVLQTIGYALYLIALAGTPVSLLAVVMQGGIALFLLMAVIFLGEHASRSEWIGIVVLVCAMLAVTLSIGSDVATSRLDARALTVVTLVGLIVGGILNFDARLRTSGAAAALGSGLAFGLAALYAKALTCVIVADPGASFWIRIAANPYLYLTAIANVAGLMMLQNAFHCARGIIAMPLSSALSNLVPIAGGMLAFGESLPAEPRLAAMRVAAFLMTIAGGLLMASPRNG
jgi:uncharacterized membrane protein